jgi:uncharacterized protein YbjQ (UPF0145 family)
MAFLFVMSLSLVTFFAPQCQAAGEQVFVSSLQTPPNGHVIKKSFGANSVLDYAIIDGFFESLFSLRGPAKGVRKASTVVIEELYRQATQRGANAILNFRLDLQPQFTGNSKYVVLLVASGDFVVLEPQGDNPAELVLSDLPSKKSDDRDDSSEAKAPSRSASSIGCTEEICIEPRGVTVSPQSVKAGDEVKMSVAFGFEQPSMKEEAVQVEIQVLFDKSRVATVKPDVVSGEETQEIQFVVPKKSAPGSHTVTVNIRRQRKSITMETELTVTP